MTKLLVKFSIRTLLDRVGGFTKGWLRPRGSHMLWHARPTSIVKAQVVLRLMLPFTLVTNHDELPITIVGRPKVNRQKTREAATGSIVIAPVAALFKLAISGKCAIPGVGLWGRRQITLSGGTHPILLNTGVSSTTNRIIGHVFLHWVC